MLSNLSNKELVQILHDKRMYSPLIEELCKRLENTIENEIENSTIKCPICSTNILLEFTDTEDGVDIGIKAIK